MKDIGIVALFSVIVSAAAPSAPEVRANSFARHSKPAALSSLPDNPAKVFTTARSAAQFDSCFTNVQDQSALPWSYVPKRNGGTFSNLGPRPIASAYFLVVSDRGTRREVRLEGNGAREIAVNRAVSQCI